MHDRAVSIETEEGAVTGVRGEKDTYPAEAVVLATGGVSYPATGSTGDGYRMAGELHDGFDDHGSELKSTLGGNVGVRPAIWVETSALS